MCFRWTPPGQFLFSQEMKQGIPPGRPSRETLQENIPFFNEILWKMWFLASRQHVLVVLMWSWVFWRNKDTERIWNYLVSGFQFNISNLYFRFIFQVLISDLDVWFLASGFCLLRLGEPLAGTRGNPGGPPSVTAFKKLYKNPLEIPKGIPS